MAMMSMVVSHWRSLLESRKPRDGTHPRMLFSLLASDQKRLIATMVLLWRSRAAKRKIVELRSPSISLEERCKKTSVLRAAF